MDKEKRITTIVLDKEADRKSRIIAEFTGKTLSAIYREALDALYDEFIRKNFLPEIEDYLSFIHRNWNIEIPSVHNAIMENRLSEAAVIIADTVKQLPQESNAQGLIREGMNFISILSK